MENPSSRMKSGDPGPITNHLSTYWYFPFRWSKVIKTIPPRPLFHFFYNNDHYYWCFPSRLVEKGGAKEVLGSSGSDKSANKTVKRDLFLIPSYFYFLLLSRSFHFFFLVSSLFFSNSRALDLGPGETFNSFKSPGGLKMWEKDVIPWPQILSDTNKGWG